jgi:hypothetical protein
VVVKKATAMHVAKITSRPKNGKTYHAYLVRHSYREGKKVLHRTLANITHLPRPVIDLVRRALKGETFLAPGDAFEIVRSTPHGHVAAVLGTIRHLGLDRLLATRSSPARQRTLAMIAQRILTPASKLSLARALDPETAISSLGEELGVSGASDDDLYAAMDWVGMHQARIEDKLAKKHFEDGSLILYDVTSSYFEGRKCPLARVGYSRDGKKNSLQIVIGLLTTREGCPVAVEVFEGNTADPNTVFSQVEKLTGRFGLQHLVLVGDRGMLTEARIREDLRPREGLSWISALRGPAIRKLMEQGRIDRSLFDESNLAEIQSPDFPGERLVVCMNPMLADERARKREALLAATEAEFEKVVRATKRKRNPLAGKDKIGLRLGRVINRYKVAKHFHLEIQDDGFQYQREEEKIRTEASLDGIYVIRSDLSEKRASSDELVSTYKNLSNVERAFRCMKTIDLKIRPIFHYKAERVRAHVFLCMLAYYVEWHMRRELAPLLFEDTDKQAARALRSCAADKAQRSESARAKAATKRNEDGDPVGNFKDLLANLATCTRNRVRPCAGTRDEFQMTTLPTAIQARAFELLGLTFKA